MSTPRQSSLVTGALLSGLTVAFVASKVHAETVLFIVGELPGNETHHDSYVLPLSQTDEIQYARRLISEGPEIGRSIAVAEIAHGADGINRDHLAAGAPEWSWHVTQFGGFWDATIEVLDGWPGGVENNVDGWIQNTGGLIGFWSYTVVDELGMLGDADSDGDVDVADQITLLTNWTGALLPGQGSNTFADGDFDFDADVDSADQTTLLRNWTGAVGPVQSSALVPEPSGLAALAIAILMLYPAVNARRRHQGSSIISTGL